MKYTATLNGKQYEIELEKIDEYAPIPRYSEMPKGPAAPITAHLPKNLITDHLFLHFPSS